MTRKTFCAVAAVLLTALSAFAQQPVQLSRFAGRYFANRYGSWSVPIKTGNANTGSSSIVLGGYGNVSLPDGTTFVPFATNAPLTISDGTLTENVTPTAVSCNAALVDQCIITASFANVHGAGASITVSSASSGLQEAINESRKAGGGVVVIDSTWGGIASTITSAVLSGSFVSNGQTFSPGVNTAIEDVRNMQIQYFGLRPTATTLIAAPSAPTVTVATGSLSSGAYRAMAAYVDCLGGVSLASTDSTQTASTTGLSIASPAATTGACGWLPYITAAGGSAGTEILAQATITSAGCTLTTLENNIPACAIGSAWASGALANPTSTSKPVAESFAHVTMGPAVFVDPPLPFQTTFLPFVVGATVNSGGTASEDLAQFLLPAGTLNTLGKTYRICMKSATATEVGTSVPVFKLLMSNNYAQSPITVSTITFPTQTQGAAGTQNGCWVIQTAAVGASGTLFSQSPQSFTNALNSAPGTQVVSMDVTTAPSSTIDLTKPIWVSINLAETAGANITGPIINLVTVEPLQGN